MTKAAVKHSCILGFYPLLNYFLRMNSQKENYGLEGSDTFMMLVILARLPARKMNLFIHSITLFFHLFLLVGG